MEKNIQTGKRIQIRREELRMNLGDVAKEVGVAVSTIQRYEKGKIEKIKLPVIEAIASYAGMRQVASRIVTVLSVTLVGRK